VKFYQNLTNSFQVIGSFLSRSTVKVKCYCRKISNVIRCRTVHHKTYSYQVTSISEQKFFSLWMERYTNRRYRPEGPLFELGSWLGWCAFGIADLWNSGPKTNRRTSAYRQKQQKSTPALPAQLAHRYLQAQLLTLSERRSKAANRLDRG